MATFFGKLIKGAGKVVKVVGKGVGTVLGGGGSPSFSPISSGFNPTMLKPATSSFISSPTLTTQTLGVAPPSVSRGSTTMDKIFDTGSKVVDLASGVKDLLSKNPLPAGTVNGGTLDEVVITGRKENPTMVEVIKDLGTKLYNGEPIATFGHQASVGDSLQTPILVGVALLGIALLMKGRR